MAFDDSGLEELIPGSSLTHLLIVVADDPLRSAQAVLQTLAASGASLCALVIAPTGDRCEHRVRLAGLRPQGARALAAQIADLPAIAHASVEHHFLRAAPTSQAEPRLA